MKLTPFGFVAQTESFLREALSLPPIGGGKWSLQRTINFTDQAGALMVILAPESGPQKVKITFHARQTGSFKDSGIQGWIEFNEGESKNPFVLKQSNSTRAAEEIFEIVDSALTLLPEWDSSAGLSAPPPAPHSSAGFEPLIPIATPEVAMPVQEPAPTEDTTSSTTLSPEEFDNPQSFVDSIFGANNPAAAPETVAPPASPEPVEGTAPALDPTPAEPERAEPAEKAPVKKTKSPKAKKSPN